MSEKLEQHTRMVEEREKVLVPVRRRQAEREAVHEMQKEQRLVKQWKHPRRWYVH